MTKTIAVFGTASDVGKSLITTALCRILTNMGIDVAPFKAQNMSNNAFVTLDAKEIGVAQAVQAFAAKIEPTADMNPVLLKPSSSTGSQIVLKGEVFGQTTAKEYFKNTDLLFKKAVESLNILQKNHKLIVIEGAGSCAEVNLFGKDFANFKTAHAASANVLLVADIDKGGVFAQIIGTLECLNDVDRRLIKGIIINKFRGDASLFEDGKKYIEEKTHIPVLGILPYMKNIRIDKEDSLSVDSLCDKTIIDKNKINIAIVRLPHISNFTDFEPFGVEDSTLVHYITKPNNLKLYDAVIIPGSKNVVYDLDWLKENSFDSALRQYKGFIFGICGGYQMLGKKILDPHIVESDKKTIEALGFLDIKTTIEKEKTLSNIKGIWLDGSINISGYEIHMGKTKTTGTYAIKITETNRQKTTEFDGLCKNNICGCYIHGIFDGYEFRHHFLKKISKNRFKDPNKTDFFRYKNDQYDKLANLFKKYIDINKLIEVLGV